MYGGLRFGWDFAYSYTYLIKNVKQKYIIYYKYIINENSCSGVDISYIIS